MQSITNHSTVCTEEQEIAVNCLTVIYNNFQMIYTQQSMQFELLGVQSYSYPYYFPAHVLLELHTNLWYQLAYPHICKVGLLTYEPAVQLERIFHHHFPELSRIKLRPATHPNTITSIVDNLSTKLYFRSLYIGLA